MDADVQITYEAEKVHVQESNDTEYTTRDIYRVVRAGSISFEHIPADASRKMDDTLMEAIEPFHFRDAVPFQSAYLAGYFADRYDVSLDERMDRARERIRVCAERSFQATVTGYNGGKRVQDSDIEINQAGYWYALYPVWLLNTTWNGNKYTFAMNGQTGKFVGDLPVDKGAAARWTVMLAAVFSVVTYGAAWLLHLIGLF